MSEMRAPGRPPRSDRNAGTEQLDRMDGEMRTFIEQVQRESGSTFELTEVAYYPPCPFDPGCVALVERAAAALGYSRMRATSGAGHDAVYMARIAPAAMIFVPCKGGLSHNELEDADPAHLEAGANVLLHGMLEKAGVASR